jgi:hypothetical protein
MGIDSQDKIEIRYESENTACNKTLNKILGGCGGIM